LIGLIGSDRIAPDGTYFPVKTVANGFHSWIFCSHPVDCIVKFQTRNVQKRQSVGENTPAAGKKTLLAVFGLQSKDFQSHRRIVLVLVSTA
jgi:hypothetical protein